MKYPLAFTMIGVAVSYGGWQLGGWWHVLHWYSLSCFVQAVGYGIGSSATFGKSEDGKIVLWARVLHFPHWLYSSTLWTLLYVFSRENKYDQVTDDLIVGRRLLANEMPKGIDVWVDLTAEFEDSPTIRSNVSYVCLPILDAWVPSAEDLIKVLKALPKGTTYVHCAQGHGCTGLFAIALLMYRGHAEDSEGAMAKLRRHRPSLRLASKQRQFVKELEPLFEAERH
jgi:protein-tyrosine phosphatase